MTACTGPVHTCMWDEPVCLSVCCVWIHALRPRRRVTLSRCDLGSTMLSSSSGRPARHVAEQRTPSHDCRAWDRSVEGSVNGQPCLAIVTPTITVTITHDMQLESEPEPLTTSIIMIQTSQHRRQHIKHIKHRDIEFGKQDSRNGRS